MYSITLEVNQICNFSCDYCYLGKLSSKRMDFVTAYQAMEIAFLNAQRHPDHVLEGSCNSIRLRIAFNFFSNIRIEKGFVI